MLERRPDSDQRRLLYYLVVSSAEGTVQTHLVGDGPLTIGRSPTATVCVAEIGASRHHCVITSTGGGLAVLDQGSTNGTFVNGSQITQSRLSHGDVVQVGGTRIRIQAQADTGQGVTPPKGDTPWPPPPLPRPLLPHEQLSLVERMSSAMVRCETTEQVASTVTSTVLEAFPLDRAMVVLTKNGCDLEVASSKARASKPADLESANMTVLRRVLEKGQAEQHICPHQPDQQTESSEEGEEPPQTRSVLCAPLKQARHTVGAIYLDGDKAPVWIGASETLRTLKTLTDVASMGVGRMRMWDELREQNAVAAHQQTRLNHLGETLDEKVEQRTQVIEEQRIELAARLQELEHVQKSRATLARGLLHDIRNVVGTMESNLAFAREGMPHAAEERTALDETEESAQRIVRMAEDVLAVSRMEDGTFPLSTTTVDAGNLARAVVRRHLGLARELGAKIGLGTCEAPLDINVDPDVMGRVLDNLVGNGLRYAGRRGEVWVHARLQSTSAELLVTDTGPGVPEDEKDRIFSEWYRMGGPSSRHHGIGLYFCQLAVRAHGGSIRVEGQEGDNRFIVSIPALFEDHETGPTTELLVKKPG